MRMAVRRGADPEAYAIYRRARSEHEAGLRAGGIVPVCAKPSMEHPHGRTGTRAGYLAHYQAKEPACGTCMEGNARQVADDRVTNADQILRGNLWSKYRLSLERYHEILREQDGKCSICGVDSPTDIRTDRFHVDHDHSCCPGRKSCGKCVRGLLCHACNTALGNFKDSPDLLLSAVAYLISHRKETTS